MRHLIEFRLDATVLIERPGESVATTIQIRWGVQCPANVRCYALRTGVGNFTEVADIEVKEGVLRALPCRAFMFIDHLG
jgi:hypothetical protein